MSQNVVAIRELLEVGAHYGHLGRLLNPKSRRFVYGQRNGISIIDLQKTVKYFKEASQYITQLTAAGGHVLFVGTKRQSRDLVKEHAIRSKQFYMNHRWLGGTLTNYPTIRKSIHKLKKIEKMSQDGTYDKLTKKEALNLERLRQKLDINLGGIKDMPALPKALFITDALKERTALLEANLLNIPVVAIVDTNVDPDGVDYPIPGNDDSLKSLELFIGAVADAALTGHSQQKAPVAKDSSQNIRTGSKVSASSFQSKDGRTVKVEKRMEKRAEKRVPKKREEYQVTNAAETKASQVAQSSQSSKPATSGSSKERGKASVSKAKKPASSSADAASYQEKNVSKAAEKPQAQAQAQENQETSKDSKVEPAAVIKRVAKEDKTKATS